jgi:hypothetical protein
VRAVLEVKVLVGEEMALLEEAMALLEEAMVLFEEEVTLLEEAMVLLQVVMVLCEVEMEVYVRVEDFFLLPVVTVLVLSFLVDHCYHLETGIHLLIFCNKKLYFMNMKQINFQR